MSRLRLLIGLLGAGALAAALASGLTSGAGAGTVLGAVNGEELCPEGLTIGGKQLNLDSFTTELPVRPDPDTSGGFRCQYVAAPGVFVQSTRITFTYYREKRAENFRFCDEPGPLPGLPGFLNSTTNDIHVFVGPVVDGQDTVRRGVLSKAEELNIGWPCEDKGAPPATSPPPASPPLPAVTTKEVPVPDPGETAKVKFPVGAKSTAATVTVSADAIDDELAVGLSEKAQKLRRLKGTAQRLETWCMVMLKGESPSGPVPGGKLGGLFTVCIQLLARIQEQIVELVEKERRTTQAAAGQDASCLLVQTRLRLVKRVGEPAVMKVVKKGLPPRLDIGCETTDTGLELTIRRRGAGTLRQALGKNLVLTIRRSDAAPAPDPGAVLRVGFSQR